MNSILWSIVLKAYLMSTNTAAILSCLSMELVILFVKEYMHVMCLIFFETILIGRYYVMFLYTIIYSLYNYFFNNV